MGCFMTEWMRGLLWCETMTEQGRAGEAFQHVCIADGFGDKTDFDKGIMDYLRHHKRLNQITEDIKP